MVKADCLDHRILLEQTNPDGNYMPDNKHKYEGEDGPRMLQALEKLNPSAVNDDVQRRRACDLGRGIFH
ncbi:hypothetical protein ACHAP5_009768 [Fusarium lateritium]